MISNIGHRGAAGLEPENTLRSFRRSVAEGADAIELDLRLTRDGRLVVLHDADVDRTTDGKGPVAGMTLDEIRQFDAGLGERIPTFEEVLETTELPIHAEIKAIEVAEPLAALIGRRGLAGRVTPISFASEALRLVKLSLPDLPVGLILSGDSPGLDEARSVNASLVSPQAAYLDAAKVEGYQGAGFRVTTWTVNEPQEMRRILELGIDGIVTDRPDLLSALTAPDRAPE
ncbi:MAG: Glycerophosphoryl diester phosphodiesterase [uncultured Rubrobacteraceae bacterium]|uniref:Glycerophosphoryl diester phosphodiesterase n=1 Tax=uncultured Rubrobacteraceae bacterium TaxID=349277 RepID=A0A6J4QIS2_9ACTN|nr:MAG: Glycerophosphoryl diester phosphodiesterase [uncultured Rubrobacteraceae bacterium]